MTRILWIAPLLAACACRDVGGIRPYDDAAPGDDGGGGDGGSCAVGSPLFTTAAEYADLVVQDGTAYMDVPMFGVFSCSTGGCTQPSTLVTVPTSDSYQDYALGTTSLFYTFFGANQDGGPTGGELHRVGLDGGGDQALAANLAFPSWLATSGSNVFWIDDSQVAPATVYCMGCNGTPSSTAWMTNLGLTYAIIADAQNVWVLADDGTMTGTASLFVCSASAPCGTTSKAAVTGITPTSTMTTTSELKTHLADDGTYAYVVTDSAVVRTDANGAQKAVVPGVTGINAVALDVPLGDLYYATDTTIYRTKSDGSGGSTTVVCGQSNIVAVAVDSANVYFTQGGTSNGAPNAASK